MLRIVIERGGSVLRDQLFKKKLISIGRTLDNDIAFDEPWVSTNHLVIRADEEEGAYRVFDHSSNGTFWEGDQISTVRFDREIVLTTGDCTIMLVPIMRTGTDEVDLQARTVVDELLPASAHAVPDETAPFAKTPIRIDLPEAELRTLSESSGEFQTIVFRERALVGRAPECDLQFSALDVSRQHFEIVPCEDGYGLRRLSTKNPVEVNHIEVGERETVALGDGDLIVMGDEEVVFLCPATHSGRGSTVPDSAVPKFDLAVKRRGCFNPEVTAVDVVGMLNAGTASSFEEQIRENLGSTQYLLIDLGFLVGIDRDGVASMERMIAEVSEAGVKVQLIHVTPKIADLLSYSELKKLLTSYVSRGEETAVRRLLD